MPIRKIKNPYNFQLCRFCNHYYLSHTNSKNESSNCVFAYGLCLCEEFGPENNLEFLEWKYDQLGKKTSGESTKIK